MDLIDFKKLFSRWSYTKVEDKNNFKTALEDNISYNNGKLFIFEDIIHETNYVNQSKLVRDNNSSEVYLYVVIEDDTSYLKMNYWYPKEYSPNQNVNLQVWNPDSYFVDKNFLLSGEEITVFSWNVNDIINFSDISFSIKIDEFTFKSYLYDTVYSGIYYNVKLDNNMLSGTVNYPIYINR